MPTPPPSQYQVPPSVEAFLKAVEARTDLDAHLRLLRVCRLPFPNTAMEEELNRILNELIDAA